ncbi:MAG: Tex family protein [Spirochaetia bacterium]
MEHVRKTSQTLGIPEKQVAAVLALFAQEATVPFIARYRKEATGGLDEEEIIQIRDEHRRLGELADRKAAVLKAIEAQGKLTSALKASIEQAEVKQDVEDLYAPYKQKRKTRADKAAEKGLTPLAELIFTQPKIDPEKEAVKYVNPETGAASVQEALEGARDIAAQRIHENTELRKSLAEFYREKGFLESKVVKKKQEEGKKYTDYFSFHEAVKSVPSHRVLAVFRGEKEDILRVKIDVPENAVIRILEKPYVKTGSPWTSHLKTAIQDAFSRLVHPQMETRIKRELKERADIHAVSHFSENLKELLLSPPLQGKRVLAVDPGLRTGCKIVCLDESGALLEHGVMYPLKPHEKIDESGKIVRTLMRKHELEAVAIGNGTGGREALAFFRSLRLGSSVACILVNESGASVYSASEAARREFAEYDLTVRGAVSIGRRLLDPLAELVKIDPQSIGVGQYQHDVDQQMLKKALDDVVVSCVNAVGADVNTASKELLGYVSGLSGRNASAIVNYRNKHGIFASRDEIAKVPGIGPKTFEQAAGFLRVPESPNPLDSSAVHPENYSVVENIAKDLHTEIAELVRNDALITRIKPDKYVTPDCGLPTLEDIILELQKPGRDPRADFENIEFAEGINDITDLSEGMVLQGVVTNITGFGAFVDIGVHQDGLVHISQMADTFVEDPHDFVSVNQRVSVTVLSVDVERNRISLTMREG